MPNYDGKIKIIMMMIIIIIIIIIIITIIIIIIIILKYFYRITASVLREKLLSMKLLMIVLQFESKSCFVLAQIIKK